MSSIPQPISLSLSNAGDTACFFPFLEFFILVEPTLVGRLKDAWWLDSLGATVLLFVYLFVFLLHIGLLVYWHSVQTLFWSPETIEVWGLDVEENSRLKAPCRSCRVVYANIRDLHGNLSDLSFIARGGDGGFVLRLLSLPGAAFSTLCFVILADRCRLLGVRLIDNGG